MRCAGSTDSHRVRSSICPSEGRGIGSSFQRNSSPVNLPTGRAFKIHWRFLLSVMGGLSLLASDEGMELNLCAQWSGDAPVISSSWSFLSSADPRAFDRNYRSVGPCCQSILEGRSPNGFCSSSRQFL